MATDISSALDELHNTIDAIGACPTELNIYDDEDMIMFALTYLMANAEHAFEETLAYTCPVCGKPPPAFDPVNGWCEFCKNEV